MAADDEPGADRAQGGAGGDEPVDHAPARTKPSRLKLSFVVVPLVVLVVASYVGDALSPSLIANAKDGGDGGLWLITLNARNRNLILATNYLEWWEYYPVGFVRLLVSDPLFYLLGWWYGDAAVRWMEKRTRTFGSMVRTAQGWFGKAAAPLVVVMPNNFICLFAGSAGMRPATFLALNVVGTAGRLYLVRWLGSELTAPIDWLVDFIREYRWPLTALSVAFVGFSIWQETRTGETELESLLNLEDELEAEEQELQQEHDAEVDRRSDATPGPDAAGEPGPSGAGPP